MSQDVHERSVLVQTLDEKLAVRVQRAPRLLRLYGREAGVDASEDPALGLAATAEEVLTRPRVRRLSIVAVGAEWADPHAKEVFVRGAHQHTETVDRSERVPGQDFSSLVVAGQKVPQLVHGEVQNGIAAIVGGNPRSETSSASLSHWIPPLRENRIVASCAGKP